MGMARAENHTPMWIQFARAASFLNDSLKLVKNWVRSKVGHQNQLKHTVISVKLKS